MNARKAMYKFIHTGARELGLDDDTRREFLAGVCGKRSCKDMSDDELRRACDALRRKGFQPVSKDAFERARARQAELESGGAKPQEAMILALWDELIALGALERGSHARLDTWMQRQLAKALPGAIVPQHPKFCTPAQCNVLIEGLKRWVAREHAKRARTDD